MPRDPTTRRLNALSAKEAMDRHIALVQMDGLGLKLNKPHPKYVYHYTNMSGLRGIVETRSLWASDHRFMNDRTELMFGLTILEMLIASNFDSGVKLTKEFRDEILMSLACLLDGRITAYALSSSFCSKGNLLSQWRAYGSKDGLAIRFEKYFLEKKAKEQDFFSGNVYYYFGANQKEEKQINLVSWIDGRIEILAKTLSKLEIIVKNELADDEEDLLNILVRGRRSKIIERSLIGIASFIKHPAFEEEAEWRCVRVSNRDFNENLVIKDRSSGSSVIPYTHLELGASSEKFIGISAVVIGPNSNSEAISHTISHLFSIRNLEGGSTIDPMVPLR